jgi:hypothetical protein
MPTPPPLARWRVEGMVGTESRGVEAGRETSYTASRLAVPAIKCVPGRGQIREVTGR